MSRSVFRKPSLKKSLSARYKGAYKRKVKKAFIRGYGTHTAGWMHPRRKLYNKVYYRTSIDTRKLLTGGYSTSKRRHSTTANSSTQEAECAWLVLGFLFLLVLGFIISYPAVAIAIAIVIGYFAYRHHHKKVGANTDGDKPTPEAGAASAKTVVSEHQELPHIPHRHYGELRNYINEPPETTVEGKKIINVRTGYPLAKQSSIAASIAQLQENLAMPEQDYGEMAQYGYFDTAVDDYFIATYLPYYFAGIAAYKRGDWDRAEAWWLSVLNLRPLTVSQKLAIMYRKQKRFKDVVKMYNWAVQCANEPLLRLREDEYQQLISDLEKAKENAAKHGQVDHSVGLKEYPNRADMTFVQELKAVADGVKEG